MRKIILFCGILFQVSFVFPQNTTAQRATWSLETRISTYIQSGYDLGVFYYPKSTKFSFGALYASHDIGGKTKELLFNSSDHDPLTMQLSWILSLQSRYHFNNMKEGLFLEAGIGIEEFRISSGNEAHNNPNGFIAPSVGYVWFPWGHRGFYLQPKLAAVFILFREDEQEINGTLYQLKSLFPSPSFAVGWKF